MARRRFPPLLDAIARQRSAFRSRSSPLTPHRPMERPICFAARVDRSDQHSCDAFDHGLTRNLGIEQAGGELVVLLVQDALPASDSCLAALTAPLLADERIAGAFARQLPRPDASAITRHYLARWVASSDAGRTIAVADRAELEALDPMARLERCAFDNVCSCIRRSVWRQHPFRRTPIARRHRVGQGGAAGGLSARIRPGGDGRPFARSIGAATSSPEPAFCTGGCMSCSGSAPSRRFRFWRGRSLRP